MVFGTLLIIFAFVETAMPECQIHDKKYAYHERNYVTYHSITDLGLAAIDNDVDAVDDLIMKAS